MLFKSTDITSSATKESADSLKMETGFKFLDGKKLIQIDQNIGRLQSDISIFFKTDGAWSAIDLIEYLLQQTGAADIYFSTWSIGPEALRYYSHWLTSGLVKSAVGIIDEGFRNRKPDLYHQAINTFSSLKFSKSHAKVTVITGENLSLTLMGSANLTRNPRTEVGVIIVNDDLAQKNINWIMEGVANG